MKGMGKIVKPDGQAYNDSRIATVAWLFLVGPVASTLSILAAGNDYFVSGHNHATPTRSQS